MRPIDAYTYIYSLVKLACVAYMYQLSPPVPGDDTDSSRRRVARLVPLRAAVRQSPPAVGMKTAHRTGARTWLEGWPAGSRTPVVHAPEFHDQ